MPRPHAPRWPRLLAVTLLLVFGFLATPFLADAWLHRKTDPDTSGSIGAGAATIHQELLVADLHADSLLWSRNLLTRHWRGHADLPRLADGRVGLQVFSVVTSVPAGAGNEHNAPGLDLIGPLAIAQGWPWRTWASPYERALHQASRLDRAAADSSARILRVRRRADLSRLELARDEARVKGLAAPIGALLSLEGADALGGRPERLEQLFAAGFRIIGLVHLVDGRLGGSAQGVNGGGLTQEGQMMLEQIRRLGMIPDLAHASPALIRDVLAQFPGPVLVSHTGLAGACAGPRNLDDDLVREIVAAGGLIGIGFWPAAVCGRMVGDVVAAIRHAISVVGIDHVALGSDFDGAVTSPIDAAGLERLTEGLLEAGLTREDLVRVMGANAMRFFRFALPG